MIKPTINPNNVVAVKNLILSIKKNNSEVLSENECCDIAADVCNVQIQSNRKISVRTLFLVLDKNEIELRLFIFLANKNITKRKQVLLSFLKNVEIKHNIKITGDVYDSVTILKLLDKDIYDSNKIIANKEYYNKFYKEKFIFPKSIIEQN